MFSSDVTARGMDYPDVTLVLQVTGKRERDSVCERERVCVCVCLYVFVCVKEREGEGDRESV